MHSPEFLANKIAAKYGFEATIETLSDIRVVIVTPRHVDQIDWNSVEQLVVELKAELPLNRVMLDVTTK